jgi:DUF4097 and DUF4098 domain-containing protein YvlB
MMLAALALTALADPALAWEDCGDTARREAETDAAGVEIVEIVAGAGELEVAGVSGGKAVRARGDACAYDEEDLAGIDLRVERSGTTVRVAAQIPHDVDGASLDFSVEVPDGVQVKLTDSSGDLRVEHVAALDVRDSSGDINVEDVKGAVVVEDSSGEIELHSVGDVHVVSDSSGGIDVRQARSVRVDTDSSGDIEASDVAGDFSVGDDSSGSITARVVGGDFTVENDSTGGIDYSGVAGRVHVPPAH